MAFTTAVGLDETNPFIAASVRARRVMFGDDDDDDDRVHLQRAIRPKLRPRLSEIPGIDRLHARMVQASYAAHSDGMDAAQNYLDERVNAGRDVRYTIDRNLSTGEGLVLTTNEATPRVKMAYRGTVTARDWGLNATTIAEFLGSGVRDTQLPKFQRLREQLDNVEARYGRSAIRTLLGHSQGARFAIEFGTARNYRSVTYNPSLSAGGLRRALANPTDALHQVYRTTEDVVSLPALFRRSHGGNLSVDAIHPHAGNEGVLGQHSLTNFEDAAPRAPGPVEQETRVLERLSTRSAQLHTIQQMHDGLARGLTFADALRAGDGNDLLPDGRLAPRIHRASGALRYYEALGGRLTREERTQVNENEFNRRQEEARMGPRERNPANEILPADEVARIRQMNPGQLQDVVDGAHSEMFDHAARLNTTMEPAVHSVRARMGLTVRRAGTQAFRGGVSLGVGIAGGVVAHYAMGLVDPNHVIPRQASSLMEGAGAGAASAAMLSAAGMSAPLAPLVAGSAAAYFAGGETQHAVTNLLLSAGASRDVSEATGAVAGGAVGGATFSIVSMVTAGALFGTALGPAGMLVGAFAGAAVGAVFGAASWIADRFDIFGSRRRREESDLHALHQAHAALSSRIKAQSRARAIRQNPRYHNLTPAQRDLMMLGATDLLREQGVRIEQRDIDPFPGNGTSKGGDPYTLGGEGPRRGQASNALGNNGTSKGGDPYTLGGQASNALGNNGTSKGPVRRPPMDDPPDINPDRIPRPSGLQNSTTQNDPAKNGSTTLPPDQPQPPMGGGGGLPFSNKP